MKRVAGTYPRELALSAVVAAILTIVLAVGCGDPLPVVEGDMAFVGVTVLPMTGPGWPGRAWSIRPSLIADRRIASINPTDDVELGDDVEVIDAEGQYLIPGLADMHGHLPSPRACCPPTPRTSCSSTSRTG